MENWMKQYKTIDSSYRLTHVNATDCCWLIEKNETKEMKWWTLTGIRQSAVDEILAAVRYVFDWKEKKNVINDFPRK